MTESARAIIADFWDEYLANWLAGDRAIPPDLRPWADSYRGKGKGAVDFEHYPDPYVGDLRGLRVEPRVIVLGLNPGVGYDQLQSPEGTWARRIAETSYSSCFLRSPAEDPAVWTALHGKPSPYWAKIIRFAQRWLDDSAVTVRDVLNFELYPWHSFGLTASIKPPPEVVDRFVWQPVQDAAVNEVFAFGQDYFGVCEKLGLPLVAAYGFGGEPFPIEDGARRRLATYLLPSGQLVVVWKHQGSASPPGADWLEVMRACVRDARSRL
jgi:hypothetical protein